MVFLVSVNSCEKNEPNPLDDLPKEVADFLNSKEFEKNENFLTSYGEIIPGEIKILSLLEFNQVVGYYLNIPIIRDENVVAYLQVLPSENVNALPNGDMYAMNLIVFSDWDNKFLTGEVFMYDLNFDNFWHSTADIENNKVSNVVFNSLPEETERKYKEFLSPTKAENCLSGSFFSCYRCVKTNYIEADERMDFVCDMPGISSYCWASASIWCGYGKLRHRIQ